MLSSIFWKDDFSKKLALEYYLFCNIWKDISFFQKYIFFRRKMKDDLSRKIQGNIGAQPDFFQGGGVYGKLGDFNKHFSEKKIKKAPQGKTMEFFFLATLKTTFWMQNLTQSWTKSGTFFQNQALFQGRPTHLHLPHFSPPN